MKPRLKENSIVYVLLLAAACPVYGQALVESSFTYQGRLQDGTAPTNGPYDFEYRLFDDDDAGGQVGATLKSGDLNVVDGLFTVELDFGAVYTGDALWLEISVRLGSSTGSYTKLLPRQKLSGAPYAMGLRLPMSHDVVSNFETAFSITNGGLSPTAHFEHSNTFLGDALEAVANGIGGSEAVEATHNGTGDCSLFEITNADSGGAAVRAVTIGDGNAVEGINEGTGTAGYFQITDVSNGSDALTVAHVGSGRAVNTSHTGLGDCGYFEISNINSVGEALEARTNGGGDAVQAINTTSGGSGRAGYFEITATFNGSPALEVQTAGPGMAILARDPIQIFGDDAEPGSGGYLILGDPTSTTIAIDNNEIMARSAGAVSTLYLNNDGGDVLVGSQLLVRGKVLCEELEVQLEEDWPDFVFEDGYVLMPLHEVEAKIKSEGHLPGIPSASTIRAEGLQIGSMQAGLLRKVEELTLHMIDLNKQMDDVRQENAILQQRLTAMSAAVQIGEVKP